VFVEATRHWPPWERYLLQGTTAGLLFVLVVGEIIDSWRKSRPIPSMSSLSIQDATAVIGSAPVLLHPQRQAASDRKPMTDEVVGN
jgi:hypothetical protein